MAKYIFLQYVDESKAPRPGSPELNAVIDAFAKYLDDVKAAGVYHDGDPCQPSAATFSVTVSGGHAHTSDGPMDAATASVLIRRHSRAYAAAIWTMLCSL